jgi:ubiquinone/menaquinone biosynthesis C-methylase UbiE
MREYYDARASEYDEWYQGLGRFDGLDRPHWDDELHELERTIAALPPARTLDVACGTGFLTRHLPGDVTGLDQSERMLAIARRRMPDTSFVLGDAFDLRVPNRSFDRVFTGHFYGHLQEHERELFLSEARRVGSELVVADAAARPNRRPVEPREERVLSDGSRWEIYKRYFSGRQLAEELGGGDVLHEGRWFVVVRA